MIRGSKKYRIIRMLFQYIMFILLIVIDRVIKTVVENKLRPIGKYPLLDGVIDLSYTQNTGAAFGSFSNSTAALSVFTGIIIVAGLVWLAVTKTDNMFYNICTPVILAGGAGNLIDRLMQGYVTDYIELLFINFAVFNFADILVTCGCISLAAYLLYSIFKSEKHKKPATEPENNNGNA